MKRHSPVDVLTSATIAVLGTALGCLFALVVHASTRTTSSVVVAALVALGGFALAVYLSDSVSDSDAHQRDELRRHR